MRSRLPLRALPALLVLLLLTALAGCGGGSPPWTGTPIRPPYDVASVPLRDAAGGSLDLARQHRLSLVFFGYAHCPDECPAVLGTLASAYRRLDPADRRRTQVVFVTTDPRRDTPRALRRYLGRFDPAFRGATGSIDRIRRAARPLHVFLKAGRRLHGGGYEVDHSLSVYAVRAGRSPMVWTGPSPGGLAQDVHHLLDAES